MEVILSQLVYFVVYFITILLQLMFYSLFGWVICSWLILFGVMSPGNRGFQFLGQITEPILRPFRWARIGPVDLSPIAAIFVLSYLAQILRDVLLGLV